MSVVVELLQRELALAESQLARLENPLAACAMRHVKEAWMCVDTLRRLEALPPCGKCSGTGRIEFMNMHPEDYEPPAVCNHCDGSGISPGESK